MALQSTSIPIFYHILWLACTNLLYSDLLVLLFFSFLLSFRIRFLTVNYGPEMGQIVWFLPSDPEFLINSAIETNSMFSLIPLLFFLSLIHHYHYCFFLLHPIICRY